MEEILEYIVSKSNEYHNFFTDLVPIATFITAFIAWNNSKVSNKISEMQKQIQNSMYNLELFDKRISAYMTFDEQMSPLELEQLNNVTDIDWLNYKQIAEKCSFLFSETGKNDVKGFYSIVNDIYTLRIDISNTRTTINNYETSIDNCQIDTGLDACEREDMLAQFRSQLHEFRGIMSNNEFNYSKNIVDFIPHRDKALRYMASKLSAPQNAFVEPGPSVIRKIGNYILSIRGEKPKTESVR